MSAEMTIVQNEFATLKYYPDDKIVHHVFHQPISGNEFRSVLNTGAETLAKYGGSKWLSDDRKNMALPDEDTQWSVSDWFPRAVKSGWKYWALVVPPDFLARLNLREFVEQYFEQGLRIMVFTEPDEALEWLREVDAVA